MKLTKLMTLIPLVALGAACNGAGPTAPDNLAAPEMNSTYSTTKAVDASCKDITGVSLKRILPPQAGTILIQSSYTSFGSIRGCPAPAWTSVPVGALIRDVDPFRIRVDPAYKFVTVYATAANGAQGSIAIGSRTDADVAGCKDIMGVDLKRLLVPRRGVVIKATYVALGGVTAQCAAPVWSSDPKGALLLDLNPFKIHVAPQFTLVTVYAMAPNGVRGQIVIGR